MKGQGTHTQAHVLTGRRRLRSMIAASFALAFAQGCAVGPDYREPPLVGADQWHTLATQQGIAPATVVAANVQWWTAFDDPTLTQLIERAARNNKSVDQALARVREARARRVVATANLLPAIGGSVTGRHIDRAIDTDSGLQLSGESEAYDAGLDARWELDLFGGLRRSREAASAQLQVSEQDLADVLITLLSDVALNYTSYRTTQARIEFARRNLASQSEAYDMTRWRAEAGLSSALDVEQARTSLEQTRAQIPALEANLAALANRLAVLLGEVPGALATELATAQPIPVAPDVLVTDLPANVLRQRPDVRAAERQLAAQSAQIGVAVANLYPSLNLSGSIGVQAGTLKALQDAATGSTYGAVLNIPIFNGGALRANVRAQNAVFDQVLAAYEATMLAALEETENAFMDWISERRRHVALLAAVESARRATELALAQYNSGLRDFEAVLTAQRAQTSLEDQLALSDGELTANTIRVYKALGGGAAQLQTLLTSR